MSKRAEQKAIERYPITAENGERAFLARGFFVKGYEQAEKDLALTPEDIKRIVDLYDECLRLTFEEGKPAYESDEFYEEVLRRFLEQREK